MAVTAATRCSDGGVLVLVLAGSVLVLDGAVVVI
jgi:hypothetical protein